MFREVLYLDCGFIGIDTDRNLERNIEKLNAAKALGYNVILVVNDVEILYEDFLKSINKKDDTSVSSLIEI